MFTKKWGKHFSIYSTMVLFHCNYNISIYNYCHKVISIPSCAFVIIFSSKTKIKSLSRFFPGHSCWSSGLVKKRSSCEQNLTHPNPAPSSQNFAKILRGTFRINLDLNFKSFWSGFLSSEREPIFKPAYKLSPCQLMLECLLLPFFFLHKSFPSLLASAWFVVRFFSFVGHIVLVVYLDYFFINLPLSFQDFFSYVCRWLLLNTSSMMWSLIFLRLTISCHTATFVTYGNQESKIFIPSDK